jgi:hypothetical protein
MVANLQESRFCQQPLLGFGSVSQHWILWKMHFPSGYVLWAQGTTHAVSKANGNRQCRHVHWWKPAIGSVNPLDLPLSLLALFFFAPSPSCQFQFIVSHLFHIENHVFALAEVLSNLQMLLSHAEFWAWTWRQAISMAPGVLPTPPSTWTTTHRFLQIFLLTTPNGSGTRLAKKSPRLTAPPYTHHRIFQQPMHEKNSKIYNRVIHINCRGKYKTTSSIKSV